MKKIYSKAYGEFLIIKHFKTLNIKIFTYYIDVQDCDLINASLMIDSLK